MATKTRSRPQPKKLSRTHKPEDLSLTQWQTALRRQAAGEQGFRIRNLGGEPVFSEFAVENPQTQRTYRVVIRGEAPGMNYCACPDYSVNTLGTCKHVEAVLTRLRKGHRAALKACFRPAFSDVYVQYGDRRIIRFAPGSTCPQEVRKVASRCFDEEGRLRPNSFDELDRLLRVAREADHELRIYDDALAIIADERDAAARRRRLEDRYGGRGGVSEWKKLLKVELLPYQRDGALFAAKAGRALIADEMGLGKTIEAIAVAELLARECGLERVLVVCPTSLKSQWQQEIEKFSGRPTLIVEGQSHRRAGLYRQDGAFFKIANYDVIHSDLEAIGAWGPELVILDEAQRIKNWQTRAAKTVKQISSRYALVLTGTPLENRIEELHSIVEFVDRHRLGPLFAFRAAHEVCEEGTSKVVGYQGLDSINRTLAPILIRRTKKEVLSQLPARMDKNFFVPMTDPQWKYHQENKDTVARIVQKWRRYKFLTEADQLRLRISLQNMRMSCDSTYLIDHETRHGVKVEELGRLLEEVFERPDQKVVIFSQWVRMNELVAEMLDHRGWGHVHLHGGVPGPQRKTLVSALHDRDDCLVFLSTDAGGVGLNLQRAATVINMDLPWNPAVLEQRIARVHRMGQKQPVRVVNFVAEHTIEHGMLSLLAFKRSVFAGVLDGASDRVFMGEGAMSRFMKTVETATDGLPKEPPTVVPADDAGESSGNGGIVGAGSAAIAGAAGGKIIPGRTRSTKAGAEAGGSSLRVISDDSLRALGELLTRGADLLASLAAGLGGASAQSHRDGERTWRPRLESDASTGRRELRIALPDEQTLSDWTGKILGALQTMGLHS